MWAGPAPVSATTLQFSLDTASLIGTTASLAFDFIGNDGIAGNNTVIVSDFYTTGTLGNSSFFNGVTVTNPGPFPVTLTDSDLFNEFLQELTLGDTVSFTLTLTEQRASSGSSTPDSFSFFLLDDVFSPLFATTDPITADALFAMDIDGTSGGDLQIFAPITTGPTWTVTSVTSVPLPSTALLFGAGLLAGIVARWRMTQASS